MLTRARFLDRITADPEFTLNGYALDEAARASFIAFDFSRIRNVAGFIAKVQHNYLWESFPGTLNLLKLMGLQIPIFSSYNRTHQRLRAEGVTSKHEKIRQFLAYLAGALKHRRETGVAVLRDVLCHEETMWQVAAKMAELVASDRDDVGVSVDEMVAHDVDQWDCIVPAVRGLLVLREFEYDPVAALSDLARGKIDLTSVGPSTQHIGYWGDSATRQLRVLVLGRETSVLLSEIDGLRPMHVVIERTIAALGNDIGPDDLYPFFESAFREGFLQNATGPRPKKVE